MQSSTMPALSETEIRARVMGTMSTSEPALMMMVRWECE